MKVILLSWLFLLSCTNSQSTPTTNELANETKAIIVETTTGNPVTENPVKQAETPVQVTKEKEEKETPAKVVPVKKETLTPPAPPKVTTKVEAVKDVVEEKVEAPTVAAVSDANWDALLQKYVTSAGKVNYKGFKKDEAKLDTYLDYLSNNVPGKGAGRKTQMAYWINAYNAFTIKLILKNYPVKSIMDINGGKAWDLKFIQLGGKKYTLNDIEHKVLRPTFKDGRIHFAVNCAAKSCPPIHNRAWTAGNLEATLAKKTKAFINDSNFNTIGAEKVKLSNIFNWYKEDFGDLIAFLNKYTSTKINADAKVSYIDYNWQLNK